MEKVVPEALVELQECSASFQDIMEGIQEDPCVLSLLERRKGQRGFRDLQGDSLRSALVKILTKLVRHDCSTCTCMYSTRNTRLLQLCN